MQVSPNNSTAPFHRLSQGQPRAFEPSELPQDATGDSVELSSSQVRNAAQAPPGRLEIVASPDVSKESLAKLSSQAQQALEYFEQNFGPVPTTLRFEVGKATDALRTGYNFVSGAVCLPYLDSVKNAGLESADIINHEIFHALLLKAYPALPSPDHPKNGEVRLHEGLADLFAHRLQPDSAFGEDYYLDKPHVREYHNDLRISLAAGSHAQGNALTSLLLASEVSNGEIKSFLEEGDFSLEGLARVSAPLGAALERDGSLAVDQRVGSYPPSAKDRYWLKKDVPLEIGFVPNASVQQAHPDFKVVWTDVKGMPSKEYVFEPTGPNQFRVSGAPDAKSEKVIARYYDGDKVVGFRPFYFGVRDISSEPAARPAG